MFKSLLDTYTGFELGYKLLTDVFTTSGVKAVANKVMTTIAEDVQRF